MNFFMFFSGRSLVNQDFMLYTHIVKDKTKIIHKKIIITNLLNFYNMKFIKINSSLWI